MNYGLLVMNDKITRGNSYVLNSTHVSENQDLFSSLIIYEIKDNLTKSIEINNNFGKFQLVRSIYESHSNRIYFIMRNKLN